MMNKTLLLTRTILKNGEGFGIKEMKSKVSKVLLTVFLIALLPFMAVMLSLFIINAYDMLFMIGQEGIIIGWGVAACSLVIFIFGIFYITSSFYFSKDVETLLPLPLKSRQIVGAKFLAVAAYEYLITAAIFLPVMIIYGVKSASGVLYYIYGSIAFAFMPVVPLVLSAVIVMILMRFTNISRHKDAFSMAAGVLALALAIGINVVMQKLAMGIGAQELEELIMKGDNSLAFLTSGMFPSARWAVSALLNSSTAAGLVNMLLFAAVSAAAYILLLSLGEMLYFKGVVGLSERSSGRTGYKYGEKAAAFKRASVLRTYTMIELKLLFRTPIYFLNCVIINFIWPFILLIPMFTQSSDVNIMEEAGKFIGGQQNGVLLLAGFAFFLFIGGFNGIASTSISREGQELFVKKYIPVSYGTQITAKVLPGVLLSMAGAVMMLAVAVIVFSFPILIALLILAVGWIGVLIVSFAGILIDLYNPKLGWSSEQQAVKQNLNVVFSMIFSSLLGGLTIFAAIKIMPGFVAALLAIIVIYGGLSAVMYYLVYKKGVRRFRELEG